MYNAKVKVILSTPWRLRRQPCQMFSKRNTIIGDIAAYKSVYTFKGILCYMLPVLRSTGRQINVTCNSIFSIWNFVKLETDMRSTILLMHKSWSLWTICQKVKICLIHLDIITTKFILFSVNHLGDHLFRTCAKFFEKLTFLTPCG